MTTSGYFISYLEKSKGYRFYWPNSSIYLKVSGSKIIFLILYVDDILLAVNDLSLLQETKEFLSKNFEMRNIGEASHVIRIEIFHDRTQGLLKLS